MQHNGPANPYEVYCYHCNVSAPVGRKRCVHCGGRLSGHKDIPVHTMESAISVGEELSGEERPRRIGASPPMTVVWILLLVGVSLYRFCTS